jgi:CubicO group peptidase (beta-lactamase class C family)
MRHSPRFIAALALLIPTALLSGAQPADVDTHALDAYIRTSMQAARIPGLALGVVRDGQIGYLKGYGIAGPDGRPATPQTPFILGSTSKSFTALAVMQLVEAGKIDLDAPVTRYLPWFRTHNEAESARISVRHLLHHTSGLPTYGGLQGLGDNDQGSVALENGVRQLSRADLIHPPGQHYEYTNENYNTLGLIVATVSGTSYEEYVRSSIFAPLQMTHSAAALSDAAAADVASGYRYWFLWPVAFDAPYPRRMTPAGFLISSAEDMAHYVAALSNGGTYEHRQLLSRSGIATLHTPVSRITPTTSYGMGWAIQGAPPSSRIWHDGDVSNFHSHVALLPDQRLGIVVLMNVGGVGNSAAISGVVDGITATLLGRGQGAPTNSLGTTLARLTPVVPLLIVILWAGWSYLSLRRWGRGEARSRGFSQFWRLYVPLTIELCVAGLIGIVVPAAVQTPLAAIALFEPDAFAILVTTGGFAVACAIARTCFALRRRDLDRVLAPNDAASARR